jgi:hypothetical protein
VNHKRSFASMLFVCGQRPAPIATSTPGSAASTAARTSAC